MKSIYPNQEQNIEEQIELLKNSINAGKTGLELVIQTLRNPSKEYLMWAAYSLLLDKKEDPDIDRKSVV